jgi:hypothetical protein
MLLGVLMLAICVIAFQHMLLATKWLVSQHILNRAAQAAVVSAAHYQAKVLNTHALINRTQMAHQIAMAHLITVASALHQAQQMQIQVRRHNPPLYLIGAFFGPHHGAAYAAAKLAVPAQSSGALRQLKKAFHSHDAMMQQQLKKQRELLLSEIDAQTHRIIQSSLVQNLKRDSFDDAWLSFLDINLDTAIQLEINQKGVTSKNIFKDTALMQWQPWLDHIIGRHDYLKPRNDSVRNFWVIDPKCPHVQHALRRQGETNIHASGAYEASDSLSFHARRKAHPVICYLREYPMGWAKVTTEANKHFIGEKKNAPRRFNKGSFRQWAQGAINNVGWLVGIPRNTLAERWAHGQSQNWQAHATPPPAILKNPDQLFVLSIRVELNDDWFVRPSSRVQWHTLGLKKLSSKVSPKQLFTKASAQIYFSQIDRSNKNDQFKPSLFQSFWQAKRIKTQDD